jgi:major vault protein
MIRGPTEYIPPIEVEILEIRKSIPLDKNEGIYVRNLDTGVVSA